MKRSLKLTAVSMIALAVAGGLSANLLAGTKADQGAPAASGESATKGADTDAAAAISEHGMAAMNDIQLARLAINDGYTDKAAELLSDAETLLKKVNDENEPVTVTAEVKVGDKPAQKQTVTKKPDLIPILSEVGFIEAVAAAPAKDVNDGTAQAGSEPSTGQEAPGASDGPHHKERMAAAEKARKQWHSGDREGAMETLKPVELGMFTRVVTMPLKETGEHLKQAINLLEKGKYHEANLALKGIEDGLVVATDVVRKPTGESPAAASRKTPEPAGKPSDQHG